MQTITSPFTLGQRVELHPATDAWMRGDRFGTVERIGKRHPHYVFVRMDRSGLVRRVPDWQVSSI